jgi:hypothetical protein
VRRAVFATVGTVLALATPAWAAGPRVRLTIDECDRLDEPSVQRIFAADLGASVTAEYGPDVTEVSIECQGPRVIVRVRDPISRKNLRRSFDSTAFGNRGESRLIAIAASELVLASWAELRSNPNPVVEPEGPKPSVEAVTTARASVRAHTKPTEIATPNRAPAVQPRAGAGAAAATQPLPGPRAPSRPSTQARRRVLAVASARAFFQKYGAVAGGGFRYGEDFLRVASWSADVLIESGRVQYQSTSSSFGAHVYAHTRGGPLTCRLGAGVRMGILSTPSRTTSVATWGWPVGAANCSSVIGGGVVVELGGEAGYAYLQTNSTGRASIRAGWFAGLLGMGLAF